MTKVNQVIKLGGVYKRCLAAAAVQQGADHFTSLWRPYRKLSDALTAAGKLQWDQPVSPAPFDVWWKGSDFRLPALDDSDAFEETMREAFEAGYDACMEHPDA